MMSVKKSICQPPRGDPGPPRTNRRRNGGEPIGRSGMSLFCPPRKNRRRNGGYNCFLFLCRCLGASMRRRVRDPAWLGERPKDRHAPLPSALALPCARLAQRPPQASCGRLLRLGLGGYYAAASATPLGFESGGFCFSFCLSDVPAGEQGHGGEPS